MYQAGDGHVEVLTASVRSIPHFIQAIQLGSDIITCPRKVIKEWVEMGKPRDHLPIPAALISIYYQNLYLNKNWQHYNIKHDLTDIGLAKFASDWKSVLSC